MLTGLRLVACAVPSDEEVLSRRPCDPQGNCLSGFVCSDSNTCLPVGDPALRPMDEAGAYPQHCSDGRHGPNESDVDCGGECPPCGLGLYCQNNASNCADDWVCVNDILNFRCRPAHCGNDNLDPEEGETDTDCGGSFCQQCQVGQHCSVDRDCESGRCRGSQDDGIVCADAM